MFSFDAHWTDVRARAQGFGDYATLEACVAKLADVFMFKFFRRDRLPVLLSPEEYRLNAAAVAFYRQKTNVDLDECYVCLQLTPDDHRTRCNHAICYKDFIKSMNGSTFICGICRTIDYFSDDDE